MGWPRESRGKYMVVGGEAPESALRSYRGTEAAASAAAPSIVGGTQQDAFRNALMDIVCDGHAR